MYIKDFLKDYRQSSRKVGPTIADDIKVAAIYSIIFHYNYVFYIWRFKNWQFGLGAIGALTHDGNNSRMSLYFMDLCLSH